MSPNPPKGGYAEFMNEMFFINNIKIWGVCFVVVLLATAMPNELINYRINFKNRKGDNIYITIQDVKNYDAGDPTGATVTEVSLVGGANPLVIETFNANGTPYGIFGKRAVISFKSTQDYGMHTFSEGEDGRFYVVISINSGNPVIFRGFVVMDDNEEEYVPPGTDVFIVATDGLGLLRGVELTDFDGLRIDPDIPLTRIKLLAYALYKTGLGIDIIVQDNLFNGLMLYRSTGPDIKNNPWDQSWLLPITFEKEVNVMDDCFTVIEKLLGTTLRLSYSNDMWWVQRVNEMKLPTISYTRFNSGGVAVSGVLDDTTHIIEVGHASVKDVYFIARQTRVKNRRPSKKVQVEYNFDIPKDMPRNKDFIRGNIITPLLDNGIVEYAIDDWRYTGYPLRPDLNTAPTGTARIWRVFEDKYEKERYVLLSNTTTPNFLISKELLVTVNDKFSFSVDWRWNFNKSGGSITHPIFHVVLQATDGTNWFMDNDGTWYQSNATWSVNVKEIEEVWTLNQVDEREWRTTSVESRPLPRDGKLMFCLNNSGYIGAVTSDVYVMFQNLSFTYIPYENGSYKKYSGERVTNTQSGRYSKPQENQLYVSAARKYLYRGVLVKYNAGVITLLNDRWFDWAMYHAGLTTDPPPHDKYLKWPALDHFNHYRKSQREFAFSLRGLIADTGKHCDIINLYKITVNSRHNNNKAFLLVSMKQDWEECTWDGTMVEIDDSGDRFAAPGTFTSEHKYIET